MRVSRCVNYICLALIKPDSMACLMVAVPLLQGTLYLFPVYCQMFLSFMISRSLSVIDASCYKTASHRRCRLKTERKPSKRLMECLYIEAPPTPHRCLALACATDCLHAACVLLSLSSLSFLLPLYAPPSSPPPPCC